MIKCEFKYIYAVTVQGQLRGPLLRHKKKKRKNLIAVLKS